MITNCSRCGKATVIERKKYNPKKKNLCKKCKDSGVMRKIVSSIKKVFAESPRFTPLGART